MKETMNLRETTYTAQASFRHTFLQSIKRKKFSIVSLVAYEIIELVAKFIIFFRSFIYPLTSLYTQSSFFKDVSQFLYSLVDWRETLHL